jgi:transcriptional regulator with XRE-family HTH domain
MEELDARGWTQRRLAQELRCSEGAITGMLADGAKTSRLVDATSEILGLALPEYNDDLDRQHHEMLKALRQLDRDAYDDEIQRVQRRIEAAKKRAPRNP